MKKINYILLAIPLISFSCTTTYRISDFSSKEKFYKEFNKAAKNKSLAVVLTNDSLLYPSNGAYISNDTLYAKDIFIKRTKSISQKEIKSIKYSGTDFSNLSGLVKLKNGNKLNCTDIKFLSDSSLTFNADTATDLFINMERIKEISYRNRWFGAELGLFLGIAGGFGFDILANGFSNNYRGDKNTMLNGFTGAIIIIDAGPVIGWIHGYKYSYQFNQ